ncbi:vomeronasal type-1 receptor 2-like [Camelus dromedarius]|uniref:Vomeronasal type-1 receptor n=2 Tax=Camelus TaxID=9836 RepID=A0A8B8TN27_CAMFR|nr:vomeronasal type-1 receptor 2-like [Camelus dromedarius]XP_032343666.1 vomeronasal type-1 receptor 2 isoform X2 [Camelus ferus]XP_032343667.1 vomeronasal type-1 receptor 2 isoform X2 [Camelus ferus]XP_045370985.1 vomeronasal type-1 receptor 2-like [Camelus bactrianus]
MDASDLAIRSSFLLVTIIGLFGNFSLLYHYVFLFCTGYKLRTVDLIVNNLLVGNILVLFSSGFHYTVTNFAWHVNSEFQCKFSPYVRVVGRGVSIGTTCLLSVFQVITISPRNSRCIELKVKAPKLVVASIILCWIMNMLINVIYPVYMTGNLNTSITNRKNFGYCSAVCHDQTIDSLFIALISFPDILSFVLMVIASGCTVFILYRHKKRVQNIHRINVSSTSSPETRATKTILLLVSTFIFFNIFSLISNILFIFFNSLNLFFLKTSEIIVACFPAISPFLLIICDSRISRLCFVQIRCTRIP